MTIQTTSYIKNNFESTTQNFANFTTYLITVQLCEICSFSENWYRLILLDYIVHIKPHTKRILVTFAT